MRRNILGHGTDSEKDNVSLVGHRKELHDLILLFVLRHNYLII